MPCFRELQRKLVVIEKGTLVIDMYDAAAKRLVWTGRAEKTLDPDSSPKERQMNISKAAEKMRGSTAISRHSKKEGYLCR